MAQFVVTATLVGEHGPISPPTIWGPMGYARAVDAAAELLRQAGDADRVLVQGVLCGLDVVVDVLHDPAVRLGQEGQEWR